MDGETQAALGRLGVDRFVLKAHEGSTSERARLLGDGAVGGVVLNSPVGGGNAAAVEVMARLGGAIAWLPTTSAAAYMSGSTNVGREVHDGFQFATVEVTSADRTILPEWQDVIDVAVQHDLILASGHVALAEVVTVFEEAHRRGVRRFLVNHPLLSFLGWTPEIAACLRRLEARVEVGILADQVAGSVEEGTGRIVDEYPRDLLVFGSDLGFVDYPDFAAGYRSWMAEAESVLGERWLEHVMSDAGHDLLPW